MLKRVAPIDVSTLSREQRDELLNMLLKLPKKNSQEQRLIADLQALRPMCECGKYKVRLNHMHCDKCIAESKVYGKVLTGSVQTLNTPLESIQQRIAQSAARFREAQKRKD